MDKQTRRSFLRRLPAVASFAPDAPHGLPRIIGSARQAGDSIDLSAQLADGRKVVVKALLIRDVAAGFGMNLLSVQQVTGACP
jgi:hypothetical protein